MAVLTKTERKKCQSHGFEYADRNKSSKILILFDDTRTSYILLLLLRKILNSYFNVYRVTTVIIIINDWRKRLKGMMITL